MEKRHWQSDHWLWAIATTAAFIALGFVDIAGGMGKGEWHLWSNFKDLGGVYTTGAVGEIIVRSLLQLGPALLVGWLIQAVAVVCGVRLARRPNRSLTDQQDHADSGAHVSAGMKSPLMPSE
jgi:hypothetical protein